MPQDEKALEPICISGTVETDRLEGPFLNPARLLEWLGGVVANDPGTERKVMLFWLDNECLELIECHSEARVCSMSFRRRGAN